MSACMLLSVIACHAVHLLRTRLQGSGISLSWQPIRNRMENWTRITSNVRETEGALQQHPAGCAARGGSRQDCAGGGSDAADRAVPCAGAPLSGKRGGPRGRRQELPGGWLLPDSLELATIAGQIRDRAP